MFMYTNTCITIITPLFQEYVYIIINTKLCRITCAHTHNSCIRTHRYTYMHINCCTTLLYTPPHSLPANEVSESVYGDLGVDGVEQGTQQAPHSPHYDEHYEMVGLP